MEIENKIYSIGVLWNLSNEMYSEIIADVSKFSPILQIRLYDLEDKYEMFLRDIYQDDVSEGYIISKLTPMKSIKNTTILVFAISISNPEYHFNEQKQKWPCTQIVGLKKSIREKYKNRIDNYVYDNIFHMCDDQKETDKTQEILKRYNDNFIFGQTFRSPDQNDIFFVPDNIGDLESILSELQKYNETVKSKKLEKKL